MARLAIAKSFLADYARLDKDAQSAVDAAIAKFAKSADPGLCLEKPQHSWDDRIRILEVDSRWRGVVLAPAIGDTYCLVTVLPKDKANAYATSRRFSVNPALGVLEVRDEETIQRLQPSLQETAELDDARLFADVSDADLTRLGVDAQILPKIRLLASEADLESAARGVAGGPVRRTSRAGLRHDRGRGPGRRSPGFTPPTRCPGR